MSRVGKKPIAIPQGVKIDIAGSDVTISGPKGQLSRRFHPDILITVTDSSITVSRPSDNKLHRSLHGLTRSLLANMAIGVSEGFQKNIELVGVGYRAHKSGEKLVIQIGYSHPVEVVPPAGISFNVAGTNRITVQGIDKELVGEAAAQLRAIRPPDPYLGKGVRYAGEYIRRKAGKSGKVGRRK